MNIVNARFQTSLSEMRPFDNQGRPEIAMTGKSNVGKSSLINCLCNRKKLARTSSEPGKTRLINLYDVEDAFFLVDLPGYGFARAPQTEKARWAEMIEGYLSKNPNIVHVLQLVDIRHKPTDEDQMMINYLRHYGLPFTVVATKADKLSGAERSRSIPVICRTLGVQPWEVIPFSSDNRVGKDKLLELIDQKLNQTTEE